MDYGHQAYIDKLSNRKFHVERALERLTRRIAQVLYDKQQWFEWARAVQEDEESHKLSEKMKIQRESALFKRHAKELQESLAIKRRKEDVRKQELFLNEAYQARISDDDEEWDPIEDDKEDIRRNYVELIRHFLWWPAVNAPKHDHMAASATEAHASASDAITVADEPNDQAQENIGKKKKKRRPQKKAQAALLAHVNGTDQKLQKQPDKDNIETMDELRERLSKGMQIDDLPRGLFLEGTIETPEGLWNRTAPMSNDEIEDVAEEIKQVKLFIFCRLLLSHAVLLPIALEADSVESFLANPKVLDKDLQELCFKMEQPDLQIVRDACADLARSEVEPEIEKEALDVGNSDTNKSAERSDVRMFELRNRKMPTNWRSKRERARKARFDTLFQGEDSTFVDFGVKPERDTFQRKKVRVKLCGHWIWNYASDVDMARSGWLIFSIMTNCSLSKATELCRSWKEFYELSVLTVFNYFPASFRTWAGDRLQQQLLMMGFMPYMLDSKAEEMTGGQQTGGRGRGQRQHAFFEARPFLCGQMRRNDPVTRRFIQYVSMLSSEVLIVARDGKTGKILVSPPEDQLWLKRSKAGIGRAARNEWIVHQSVGRKFFEEMDAKRSWSLSFDDYYDVYIWALEPGEYFHTLTNVVNDVSFLSFGGDEVSMLIIISSCGKHDAYLTRSQCTITWLQYSGPSRGTK